MLPGQIIRFCLERNLSKNFILNHSLSWCCLSEIVLNPDQAAPSKRAGVCSLVREVSTFYRQCLLQVSYDIKLPCSSQLWLVRGLLLQLEKWLWKQMKCEKLDLMCFKSILTKMLSLVKSIVHKMLRLVRSGGDWPTAAL